MDQEEYHYI